MVLAPCRGVRLSRTCGSVAACCSSAVPGLPGRPSPLVLSRPGLVGAGSQQGVLERGTLLRYPVGEEAA